VAAGPAHTKIYPTSSAATGATSADTNVDHHRIRNVRPRSHGQNKIIIMMFSGTIAAAAAVILYHAVREWQETGPQQKRGNQLLPTTAKTNYRGMVS
jgi:hypothetical protein